MELSYRNFANMELDQKLLFQDWESTSSSTSPDFFDSPVLPRQGDDNEGQRHFTISHLQWENLQKVRISSGRSEKIIYQRWMFQQR